MVFWYQMEEMNMTNGMTILMVVMAFIAGIVADEVSTYFALKYCRRLRNANRMLLNRFRKTKAQKTYDCPQCDC
jgi:hypothetical protein